MVLSIVINKSFWAKANSLGADISPVRFIDLTEACMFQDASTCFNHQNYCHKVWPYLKPSWPNMDLYINLARQIWQISFWRVSGFRNIHRLASTHCEDWIMVVQIMSLLWCQWHSNNKPSVWVLPACVSQSLCKAFKLVFLLWLVPIMQLKEYLMCTFWERVKLAINCKQKPSIWMWILCFGPTNVNFPHHRFKATGLFFWQVGTLQ